MNGQPIQMSDPTRLLNDLLYACHNDTTVIVGKEKLIEIRDAILAHSAQTESQPTEQQNARFAIDGAIAYGRMGINKPPSADHWLMPYWEMGYELSIQSQPAPADGAKDAEQSINKTLRFLEAQKIWNGQAFTYLSVPAERIINMLSKPDTAIAQNKGKT